MTEPVWLSLKVVLAIHSTQLAKYGGLAGTRDTNLLESALSKPRMAYSYEETPPDIFTLAAILIIGMARNHPFNDANKRTSYVAGLTFLALNHIELAPNPIEAVLLMVRVAQGDVDTPALATWLKANIKGSKP